MLHNIYVHTLQHPFEFYVDKFTNGKRRYKFSKMLAVGIKRDYVDQNSHWYYIGDNRTDITIPRPEYESGECMMYVP